MELQGPQNDEVNFEMTPMIDVVFLLIAFFMTVTSFASAELVKVSMPVAPEAKVPEDSRDRQFISIDADGNMYLGAKLSDLESIQARVGERNGQPGFKGVYLRADANTPYRLISRVMKACAEVGVSNIIFGVEQQKSN